MNTPTPIPTPEDTGTVQIQPPVQPANPTPTYQGSSSRVFLIVGSIVLGIIILGVAIFLASWLYTNATKSSSQSTSISTSRDTTQIPKPSATSSGTYTDTVNGFSFDPGASMNSSSSPFLFAGYPYSDSAYVLIAQGDAHVQSSDSATVTSALQSLKLSGYTGSNPTPVQLSSSAFTGYVINYKYAGSGGQENQVWQCGFYAPKTSMVIALSIISPSDAMTAQDMQTYAYQVFRSISVTK